MAKPCRSELLTLDPMEFPASGDDTTNLCSRYHRVHPHQYPRRRNGSDQRQMERGSDLGGRNNGYTNLQDAPANDDNPRANVTFWDALRWCNARSEKEGLTPAYYMDSNEAIKDINQNGSFEARRVLRLGWERAIFPGLTTVFRAGANIPNYGKHHPRPKSGTSKTFYRSKKMPTVIVFPNHTFFQSCHRWKPPEKMALG